MSDASLVPPARRLAEARRAASLAGHEMAVKRWGTRRLDRQIAELSARSDELGPSQLERLRTIVEADAPSQKEN